MHAALEIAADYERSRRSSNSAASAASLSSTRNLCGGVQMARVLERDDVENRLRAQALVGLSTADAGSGAAPGPGPADAEAPPSPEAREVDSNESRILKR